MSTEQPKKSISIGIDFGTSKFAISYRDKTQQIRTVTFNDGSSITPAWLRFISDTPKSKMSFVVGEQAKYPKDQLKYDDTFYNIKRFLGKTFEELQDESESLGFEFKEEKDHAVVVVGSQQPKPNTFRPKEIAALFFKTLMNQIKMEVPDLVRPNMFVGVPVKMTAEAVQDLTEAAKLGGFETVDVVTEPIATVLYYLDANKESAAKNFIVIDIGAGTTDISCIQKNANGYYESVYSDGNNDLGGNNFDAIISEMITEKVREIDSYFYKIRPSDLVSERLNKRSRLNILKKVSEDTKIAFSTKSQVEIEFKNLLTENDMNNSVLLHELNIDDTFNLQRSVFTKKAQDLFDDIKDTIFGILKHATVQLKNFGKVILVGGGARIPGVKEAVTKAITRVNKNGNCKIETEDKMTTVSEGCAIHASNSLGTNVFNNIIQRSSYTVGLSVSGVFETVVPREVVLPVHFEKTYECEKGEKEIVLRFYKTEIELKKNVEYRTNCMGFKHLVDVKIPPGDSVKIEVDVDLIGNTAIKATLRNGQVLKGGMLVDTSSLDKELLALKRHIENTISFN
ncbi:heat shock protein 70, putative [Entamoeba invadens IP1]|uniref:Heat shock protein 70, putative n=1 Tax=Entamoeba invadens IP1 TaxID=370355 RepID=A0A0A1U4A8_ENTIV|nr:heat shock protein 70, putative [Entamoeba invadens IP1]ELP87675.1 heat shock protein 70, putative [Entamoeba invadens IP1]|eukprot:XP_004254446.1 heat shock protein 70, putative [Entamoeba invadens IP1]